MRIDEEFMQEHFDEIKKKLDFLYNEFRNKQDFIQDPFIDNARFMQLMNISQKTAQSWRDTGVVEFTQINSKIYYKASDINIMMEKYHRQKP